MTSSFEFYNAYLIAFKKDQSTPTKEKKRNMHSSVVSLEAKRLTVSCSLPPAVDLISSRAAATRQSLFKFNGHVFDLLLLCFNESFKFFARFECKI